ncbi:2-oxoglutarate dehydrogenase complex dihydrolipoyllysine-residue succinyltransferase [Roseivirga sp. BDSF3-8]|uniref:2-oxoglutarate dehydrogenase complex dihydrolipoyllysine-residue succinyltransferase n=1 Tax=Roseivirga sp. BDSF3-8 TaxID=3241598 RepID=UPI003531EE49
MSIAVKVPAVGESINEVTIAQWLKSDGDYVEMDEVICELESDKATFELNAEASGVLKIKAKEGETLEVGALICQIDENGDAADSEGEEKPEAKKSGQDDKTQPEDNGKQDGGASKTGEVIEMSVPAVGESITEVTISSWLKKDGDFVDLDEVIAEIESDKATFELTAEASGFLSILAEEGKTLEIGSPVCKIEVAEESSKKDSGGVSEKDQSASGSKSDNSTYATGHASPAAAKILKEKGISPDEVKGSGVDGRITKEDAMSAQKSDKKASDSKPAKTETNTSEGSAPEQSASDRSQRREKMSNLRKTIARRLVSVKNETAMLTTFNEVNMQPVMELRKKYKDTFKDKYEVGLGFMSFFTKAVCMALHEFPAVNAMIDQDEIVFNDYCDVSIAVSTDRGLVVPVIRNAEKLGFHQIEKEIVRLATKAKNNRLSIDEMSGGTFTITNGGIFGSMLSTPIINAPQSAILGMHNIVERPVVENGEVVVRPIMYLALSYDHRIIDGKESVSFLVRVKSLLEDPARLLLGV